MGFHLWVDGELAWAQGSYEYRPMGAAVISLHDLFKRRDFSPRRQVPRLGTPSYVGQFASLGQLNALMRGARSRRAMQTAPNSTVVRAAARRVSGAGR